MRVDATLIDMETAPIGRDRFESFKNASFNWRENMAVTEDIVQSRRYVRRIASRGLRASAPYGNAAQDDDPNVDRP